MDRDASDRPVSPSSAEPSGLGPISNKEMERMLTYARETGQLDARWYLT